MGQLQAWAKDIKQEVQTEDDGYEYMAEAYPKLCQAGSVVEAAWAKVAWTLPLL